MADNANKIKAIGEIKKLKKTDYCQILTEMKNINDPVLARIHIYPESKTRVDYTCKDESNKKENPYAGGFYVIEILFGKTFPEKAPTVLFRTPILHANISKTDGYICLDALNKWKVSLSPSKSYPNPSSAYRHPTAWKATSSALCVTC